MPEVATTIATVALYGGAPLWPASHLPHLGGDRMSHRVSPIFVVASRALAAKLPISPLVGEMSGRTEGGAVECRHQPASPITSPVAPSIPSGRCVAATIIPPSAQCFVINPANRSSEALSSPAVGSSSNHSGL